MAQLGQFALALALVMTVYSVTASLLGIWLKNEKLIASGRNAVLGTFACTTTAIGVLAFLFISNDFSVRYIAEHSNQAMPLYFKISAIWGGQEGSLLFWGWLLTLYSALVVVQNWRKHSAMMPYVIAVLMSTSAFFTALHLFAVNPFAIGAVQQVNGAVSLFTPRDGSGLNPLLQDWLMAIHPPMLYLGYVGFVVPFAFAMAAMITRQLGDTWIRTTRRWTMVAWFFLGTGILLGGNWAYHELGWGGFWAWDPVENAALMPWLIGTAFLHSVMIQEKKGMLKIWNMVLVILSYILCIFGTFLTRSGVVSSVHAFAQSSIGGYFLAFILVGLAGSLYLLFDRLPYLKADNQLESMVSRESSFLFNNLVLLLACFAVFWGTMFPVLSEAAPKWLGGGEKVTVGPPFFNAVNVPIAIFLVFLTGVGPLLAWRKTSANSLKRAFLMPGVVALAGGGVMYAFGIRHFYAWMSLVMCIFVTIAITREFIKGALARGSSNGENFIEAVINLTLRNTRRYGGYVVHFGFVLLFVGWAGQAFTDNFQFEGGVGDTIPFHQYVFRVEKLGAEDNANFQANKATVGLFENDRKVALLYPEQRVYKASQQPSTEVSIRSTAREDVYLVFQGLTPDRTKAVFQVFINPLTMWVWVGGVILGLGTLIAMLPNKKTSPAKRQRRRTQTPESKGPEVEVATS